MKYPMKRHAFVLVFALAAVGLTIGSANMAETPSEKSSKKPSEKPATGPAAALSAKPKAGDNVDVARYAWYLFVQAMTPASGPGGPLAFENWTEQCEFPTLFCPSPTPSAPSETSAKSKNRKFHGSPLKAASHKSAHAAANPSTTATPSGLGSECNSMNTTGFTGYPAPSNVTPSATFCEEVFVNGAEKTFVTTNGLTTLTGQQAYGKAHGGAITFPWDAVEIKVDWVPTSSFNPPFQCPDPTGKLYTETIDGVCYAMVGLHISSKVLPNWLWATFEPNSSITNPNRCDPKLYNVCFDPWGTTSSTPYAKGQPVPAQSAQLQQAMTTANLNKAFNNYYLTAVQTEFVSNGKPVPMGSSFVEFNAGVAPGGASCITCHRYAYFDNKSPANPPLEDNFGFPPAGWSAVGYACQQNPSANCTPVIPNSTSQDFSWMLGLMPYGNNSSAAPASTSSGPAPSPSPSP